MPRYRRSLALDHWDRVLTDSVKNNTQVLINCRNNKKLLGRVKAFEGTAIWFLSRSKRFGLKSLRLAKAPKEGKASKQGQIICQDVSTWRLSHSSNPLAAAGPVISWFLPIPISKRHVTSSQLHICGLKNVMELVE